MARMTPDPTFYPSPADAAAAPGRDARVRGDAQHRHQRRPRAGRADRDRPRGRLADLRPARRAPRHAGRRRRAAPLRLERVLVARCARGRRTRTSSAATCSSRACAPRTSTSSTSRATPGRSRSSSRPSAAEEIARKAGYSRPHTVHCGPDGIYVSALGNPEGDGPGGIFLLDHDDFSVKGAVGGRPRAAGAGLRLLVAPQLRDRDHVRVGHAEHGRGRPDRRAAAGQQVRPQAARLGPEDAPPRPGDRPRAGEPDGARAAARARPAQGVRVRRRRHVDRGPDRLGLALGAGRRRHGERSRR